MSVSGDYIPVTGDFDGDGCGDVLWYGAGHAARLRVVRRRIGGGPSAVSVTGLGYVPRSR